jgi:hypothetical protein
MWSSQKNVLGETRGMRIAFQRDSNPATFTDVLHALQTDAEFRTILNGLLADAPFTAFRWETPPVTDKSLKQPFEFVLLDDPGLDRRPDSQAFASYFGTARDGVATFPNLGGDAILVVPLPIADASAYGHLAAFVRLAPERQRHTLWQSVGEAMSRRVGARPVWMSTAGAGVSWLHVRLDDRPKYYGYAPYRRLTDSDPT